jgi:hypothetical protein
MSKRLEQRRHQPLGGPFDGVDGERGEAAHFDDARCLRVAARRLLEDAEALQLLGQRRWGEEGAQLLA